MNQFATNSGMFATNMMPGMGMPGMGGMNGMGGMGGQQMNPNMFMTGMAGMQMGGIPPVGMGGMGMMPGGMAGAFNTNAGGMMMGGP